MLPIIDQPRALQRGPHSSFWGTRIAILSANKDKWDWDLERAQPLSYSHCSLYTEGISHAERTANPTRIIVTVAGHIARQTQPLPDVRKLFGSFSQNYEKRLIGLPCLSVHVEQLDSHWMDFSRNLMTEDFAKVCQESSSFIEI